MVGAEGGVLEYEDGRGSAIVRRNMIGVEGDICA
jgi:hypothetical protein